MKTLLIVLFIILFIYLIIHMCSGSDDRGVPTRSNGKGFDKSLLVLDGLRSLGHKDLSRLRDDLHDLKAVLDKKPVQGGVETVRAGRRSSGGRHLKSGKEVLSKIRKDMNKLEGYKHRGNAFSKLRVVLVQIALILITILMIVL